MLHVSQLVQKSKKSLEPAGKQDVSSGLPGQDAAGQQAGLSWGYWHIRGDCTLARG